MPVHFQFHAFFDTAAARRDLGFSYTIRWEEGAWRCVDWFRTNGDFPTSDQSPEYDLLVEAWRESLDELAARIAGGGEPSFD